MKNVILAGLIGILLLVLLPGCEENKSTTAANEERTAFTGLSAIAGARIGVMTGSTGEDFLYTSYPQADIKSFDDIMDAVAALKANQLEGVMVTTINANLMIRKNPDLDMLPDIIKKEKACIAVNKNNSELLAKINDALTGIKEDGTLDDIVRRWIKEGNEPYEPKTVETLKNGPVLKVGVSANREPLGFIGDNGEYTGLDEEVAKNIALRLGMQAEFTDMKFSALIAALQSKKIDCIISTMSVTPEREKQVSFTQSYFDNNQVFLIKKEADNNEEKTLADRIKDSFYNNIIAEKRYMLIAEGLEVTVTISLLSVLLGTILGAMICFLRMSRNRTLKTIAQIYIAILRGTPIVVFLMISYYLIFASVSINPVMVAVIAFGMNFAAYVSEMFRTSIESVDKGQWEAGIASGFTRVQTFRYIIMPQSVKHVLPVYKGEFISLVKMTSVVGYIAVQDLTKASDIIRSRTFDAFFPLIMVAILYFLISWLLISVLSLIEERTDPKANRRRAKQA